MATFINQSHTFSDGTVRTITLSGEHKDVESAQAHLVELEGIFGKSENDTFTFVDERLV